MHSVTHLYVDNVPEALQVLTGDLLFTSFQLTVIDEVRKLGKSFLHEQLCLACCNTYISAIHHTSHRYCFQTKNQQTIYQS